MMDVIIKRDELIEGLCFEDLVQDDKTTSAFVRKIKIIGEAVKHLPEETKNRFQEIPRNLMAKTRDKIIHFCHGIDYDIIWKIIKGDLPTIISRLKQIYYLAQKEEK